MSVLHSSQTLQQPLFYDVIRERRSVRHYDAEAKISREDLNELLQQASLAPSAANLQPWRFLVIDSPKLKQKLYPIAFNQQQVIEASAVVAVLGDLECVALAGKIYGQAVDAGFMSEETAKSFVERYTDMYANMPLEEISRIVLADCGMAAMQFMLAARAKGYDTVPMGGYDKMKFVETFTIPDRYVSVMLIAVGKAAKPGHPTVRLPITDIASYNEMLGIQ
jgi:nitroreductase